MDLHLVSHTHWDREWYRTAEVFRQRSVDLIDDLIESPPAEGEAFLLDGQAIVIEDYLDVRPDQRERLRGLLQAGRIEAGPWYVLADELIPSGEALVRNLLAGRAILDSLGAKSPPVLYCPDSFGHPAALPEIANGFGLPLIIVWRGYGGRRWPSGDVVRWAAPSGAESIVFHLPPDGYEFGSSLPAGQESAAARWVKIREVLAGRSTVGVTMLQNGADHHARQAGLAAARDAFEQLAASSGDKLRTGSLTGFAESLAQRAKSQRLPVVAGELRDSYGYTWTLQGTFATRAGQKRANAIAERSLFRAEAWCAASRIAGGRSRAAVTRAAWKTVLQAHPHDTLCGTSIDDVAAAMDLRLRSALLQANAIGDAAVGALLRHDPADVREAGTHARDLVVIENGVPYERGGVVFIERTVKIADEPVGPGSQGGPRIAEVPAGEPKVPSGTQLLSARVERNRIESPRHYPDNDIVQSSLVACYVTPTRGLGIRVLDATGNEVPPPSQVLATRSSLASESTRITFGKGGAVSLAIGKRWLDQVIRFEDRVDEGDLYTPSIRGVASPARFLRSRLVHRGPLVGEITQEWTFGAEGEKRGAARTSADVAVRMVADSPLIEVQVTGVNQSTNHRLRIGIATGIGSPVVMADAAFGVVERKPIKVTDKDRAMETPPATAPLHRYVSLFGKAEGVTVHSDGLAEYEADDLGVVWITLARAVGDLSRNDLPERPGHAGWPEDVPAAQCLGPFEARLAIQLHGAAGVASAMEVARESDRFLSPLRGDTLRSATTGARFAGGIELSGAGLVMSAAKESEDGRGIVLRCVNLSDKEQRGVWTLWSEVAEAHLARLDETPIERLDAVRSEDHTIIGFTAGPRAVVTILCHPERSEGPARAVPSLRSG